MKNLKYLFVASLAAVATVGCSDDREALSGEGSFMIEASVNADIKVKPTSRAATIDDLGESLLVWISQNGKVVRQYIGAAELPSVPVTLLSGSYVAEAWAGDSASADWEKQYFKAYVPFDITPNNQTEVKLVCKIANVVASVEYGDEIDGVLSDYTLTVGHDRGQLTFEGRDARKAYFMMPSTDKNLAWTLTGKKSDGTIFTRSGVLENVLPAHEYAFKIACAENNDEIGGGFIKIEIDDTEIEVKEEYQIVAAPEIKGVGFDLAEPVQMDPDAPERTSLYVTAATALRDCNVQCDAFTTLGLPDNNPNLMRATEAVQQQYRAAGIRWEYVYQEDKDISNLKLSFEEEFFAALPNGVYTITVTAADINGKTATETLTVNISSAPIAMSAVADAGVWASKATVAGVIRNADGLDTSSIKFSYAPKGSMTWTDAAATVSGTNFSAELTGLEPGTTYQVVAATADYTSDPVEFTTEEARQLPNASFEDWITVDGKGAIPQTGSFEFWGNGNQGAQTLGKDITEKETDAAYVTEGSASIRMRSQFVGVGFFGKFAAGNVFAGEYLETDGTDGILGWGREWTSRPAALKGYARYERGSQKYNGTKKDNSIDDDLGIVYVALMDDATESYGGKTFAKIVKTKTAELFEPDGKDAAHVIAYGRIIFEPSATPGMAEFTVNLDYRRTDIRPSRLILVASASKEGDYFKGQDGSTLWLDDLKFVY